MNSKVENNSHKSFFVKVLHKYNAKFFKICKCLANRNVKVALTLTSLVLEFDG